ncbi:hypothetical protein K443DRAFT_15503 [Laccaria amethystina LaAM-08-1]|uniref:Uncharacterized protein n=1 Tax=Laccaria amethystina LaAM-08-1 TaxID=1095629 RepID=A0A0C9WLA4_9AGAR|nr:hypothetical protein K443DRAFT_15503 [Laccaria amethystina LaAM-08-1]
MAMTRLAKVTTNQLLHTEDSPPSNAVFFVFLQRPSNAGAPLPPEFDEQHQEGRELLENPDELKDKRKKNALESLPAHDGSGAFAFTRIFYPSRNPVFHYGLIVSGLDVVAGSTISIDFDTQSTTTIHLQPRWSSHFRLPLIHSRGINSAFVHPSPYSLIGWALSQCQAIANFLQPTLLMF